MKSLLDALQEGRLVELPTNDKNDVLEYLALLLEAVPGIQSDVDIVKEIRERETEGNTGLGKGIACPHIRTKRQGDLLCSVGWSPAGIDYGASDGKKVHIVIMYYIPDTQRVAYLKELSSLAKAVVKASGENLFENIGDIHTVRNRLLDWVELSVSDAVPDATARMIRLEEKQTVKEAVPAAPEAGGKQLAVVPFILVRFESGDFKVLAQDSGFLRLMETAETAEKFSAMTDSAEVMGYQISVVRSQVYASNRVLRECVAVKPR
ncbi:MAG: PTS sugar transporter subunit IIA [Chitinispirillaceae bacterium]|jgi:mannitol/fructose-specific phosphotransferase system IIA component (Ntr-type)